METSSSITYLLSIGLFVVVGIAAMAGLPERIFARTQGHLSRAMRATLIFLFVTLLGAAGIWFYH